MTDEDRDRMLLEVLRLARANAAALEMQGGELAATRADLAELRVTTLEAAAGVRAGAEMHDTAPPELMLGQPRPPLASVTTEVRAARDSMRVVAMETAKQTPILEEAAAHAKASAESSAAAATETATQTPMIQAAAASAATAAKAAVRGATATQIGGVANFVGLVILSVLFGITQRCAPALAPPAAPLRPLPALSTPATSPAPLPLR